MSGQVRARIIAGVLALAVAEILAPGADAQTLNPVPVKPVVDGNGVDVVNWTFSYEISPISIGPSDQDPIRMSILLPTERDSFYSNMRVQDPSWESSTRVTATLGGQTWSILGWGVVSDPGAQFWMGADYATVMARDGTLVEYEYPPGFFPGNPGTLNMCAARVTKPNGEVLTFHNKLISGGCRPQSIVSSRGYQIKYEYHHTGSTAMLEPIPITTVRAGPFPGRLS